jgi:septal ring-binding cell division protein DamX
MSKEDTGEVKGVMSSALLLGAVAVVLVTGMMLRTDGTRNVARPDVPASPAASLPLGSTITPDLPPPAKAEAESAPETEPATEAWTEAAPAAVPPGDPLTVRLATRAEADSGRLASAHGRWTAQLLVACKPETVNRMLEQAKGVSSLYVLPVHVNDDACFRVCFGAYATAKQAAVASDLPKALRGKEKIGAVEIAKVLP